MTTESDQEMIEAVLADFDFASVLRCMDLLGLRLGDNRSLPTIDELRSTARSMLESAARSKGAVCATGGFHAQRLGPDVLSLLFYVVRVDRIREQQF